MFECPFKKTCPHYRKNNYTCQGNNLDYCGKYRKLREEQKIE